MYPSVSCWVISLKSTWVINFLSPWHLWFFCTCTLMQLFISICHIHTCLLFSLIKPSYLLLVMCRVLGLEHSGIRNQVLQAVILGKNFSRLVFIFVSIFFSLSSLWWHFSVALTGCTMKCVQKYKYKNFTENKHPFVINLGCVKSAMLWKIY